MDIIIIVFLVSKKESCVYMKSMTSEFRGIKPCKDYHPLSLNAEKDEVQLK